MSTGRRWLIQLSVRHDFIDFIFAEIVSLADYVGLGTDFFTDEVREYARKYFRIIFEETETITQEKLERICSRSVSTHGLYELLEEGSTYQELIENLKSNPDDNRKDYYTLQFAFGIEMVNRNKMSMPERLKKFENLEPGLPMTGKINLNNPEVLLVLLERYPPCKNNEKKKPEEMDHVFLSRFITGGQRKLIQDYAVTNRIAVGNTSMDAELALWMSNIAQIDETSFVFDPFVGTGSLLLTSAHYGSHVIGSDINYNVMMAKGKSARMGQGDRNSNETLFGSLAHFDLENKYIGAAIIDNNINPWRECSNGWFDAIITDPPYGVREKCEKVGHANHREDWINFEMPDNHFPDKVSYNLADVFNDLLAFSFKHLRNGGRLIFWFPVSKDELNKHGKDLYPRHSGFDLMFDCEQCLNTRTSRILLTYEKVQVNVDDEGLISESKVHAMRNGFRELYFQPTKPGTVHPKKKVGTQWNKASEYTNEES